MTAMTRKRLLEFLRQYRRPGGGEWTEADADRILAEIRAGVTYAPKNPPPGTVTIPLPPSAE